MTATAPAASGVTYGVLCTGATRSLFFRARGTLWTEIQHNGQVPLQDLPAIVALLLSFPESRSLAT